MLQVLTQYPVLANGTYSIEVLTNKPHGGITAADILPIKRYIVGGLSLSALQLKAADIGANNAVTASDVLPLRQKLVGSSPASWRVAPFVYYPNTFTVNGSNATLSIQSLCGGDVNASHTPSND